MKKKLAVINIEETFWGRFTSSEQLEDFCRPALIKAAAAQDEMRAKARVLREQREADKKGEDHAPT